MRVSNEKNIPTVATRLMTLYNFSPFKRTRYKIEIFTHAIANDKIRKIKLVATSHAA